MESNIENELNRFLDNPIELNVGMVLTNEDIESIVLDKDLPKTTLKLKIKEGFPTYCVITQSRTIIVFVEDAPVRAFVLKPDSKLLSDYIDKYGK